MGSRRVRQYLAKIDLCEPPYTVINEKYDQINCPQGVINLGISQSKLVFDLVEAKLKEPGCFQIEEKDTAYGEEHGIFCFKEKLTKLMGHNTDPDNLIVMNGICPIICALGFALGDHGDGFLFPTPCYHKFESIIEYTGISFCPAHIPFQSDNSKEPFDLTVSCLEKGLKQAQDKGINVCALVICNPDNPIGRVYSEEQMREYFHFAKRHSLHVIVDEVYMFSVFGDATMKSTLHMEELPLEKEFIHVVWGFGKGFGMAGFHCGFLHSYNKEVIKFMRNMVVVHSVSTVTQKLLTYFLKDKVWLDQVFFPTHNQRIKECYSLTQQYLFDLSIPFIECTAGFFIWVDLRKFMTSVSEEGEQELSKRLITEGKVKITEGSQFSCQEYGWFRIVFTVDLETLRKGLERMKTTLLIIQSKLNERQVLGAHGVKNEFKIVDEAEESESLEDMVRTLCTQIRGSDWLEVNSADKWVEENPDIAHVFLK